MTRSRHTSKAKRLLCDSTPGLRSLPEREACRFLTSLRRIKASRKITLGRLAIDAGVSRITMYRWLHGHPIAVRTARDAEVQLGIKRKGQRAAKRAHDQGLSDIREILLRFYKFGERDLVAKGETVGRCAVVIQSILANRGVECGVIVAPNAACRSVIELYADAGRFAVELEGSGRRIHYRLIKGPRNNETVAGFGQLSVKGAFFCASFLSEAPLNCEAVIPASFREKTQFQTLY